MIEPSSESVVSRVTNTCARKLLRDFCMHKFGERFATFTLCLCELSVDRFCQDITCNV